MKRELTFIKNHWFGLAIVLLLILASLLRFYDYNQRWGLGYDQEHDALVSRAALHNHALPGIGPFSSAGPFIMGPEWYYFIIMGTVLYPFSPLTPWILLTMTYFLTVYIMILIGKELGGKLFGIILGLITAVSTVEISQAINLTNQAPLSVLCAIALWGIVKYLHTKKNMYIVLASLSIGIGVNIHLQGVLLLPLICITLIAQRPSLKGFICVIIGLVIPFIPLIFFDFTHNHYEMKNMLQYYLHDQYKINLNLFGRRWTTYLGQFWPVVLAEMIGGYIMFSYCIISLAVFFGLYNLFKKMKNGEVKISEKNNKFTIILLLSFSIAVTFLRYTHTPLFSSYLMFLHPIIFIIVGWTVSQLMKKQFFIGLLFLLVISAGSIIKDIKQMSNSLNMTALEANTFKNALYTKYPHEKFAVYDYNYKTPTQSMALSLFLDAGKKIDDHGHRIGVLLLEPENPFSAHAIGQYFGYQLVDLQSSSSAALKQTDWALVTPNAVYDRTENWYK